MIDDEKLTFFLQLEFYFIMFLRGFLDVDCTSFYFSLLFFSLLYYGIPIK